MLQQMRSFTKGWVANVFMGLIALSFAAWGIGDMIRGRVDTSVATVGSDEISQSDFSREVRNILMNESQREGHQITTEDARKSGMAKAILDQMIDRTAFDQLVDDLGLTVGDDVIADRIRRIDAFNGPLGTFDKSVFQRLLQQRGYSEDEFVASMRGDLARGQLLSAVEAGFSMPPGYAKALYGYFTETRAVEFVTVSPQSVGQIAPPGDAVLAAFVKAHPERFSTPEYRSVTVAAIGPEDVAPTITVSDAQLKKSYEDQKSKYVVPDKRDVQQITFPDEASAKAAKAKIDGGTAFEGAAFQAKTTVDERKDVSQDDLGALGKAAFALPLNGISDPVKNFASWVLLKVTKITPGKTVTFDQAKPEIEKDLKDRLAKAKIDDMTNAFKDAYDSGAEVAQAAKKAGMKVIHVAAVDAQGLGPDGKPTALPVDPELIAHIFATEVGEPTDAFPTTKGDTYVVSVEGITPPKPKSLDAVRTEATRVWTDEQRAKLLKQKVAALTRQAEHDGSLTNVAHTLGAPVQNGPAISRMQPSQMFPPALMQQIFSLQPNGIASGQVLRGGDYVILRVSGIQHTPISPSDMQFRRFMGAMASQAGQNFSQSLANAQRDKDKVSIDQKNFDQALGGGEGS